MKKIYLVGLAFALLTASCDDVLEKTSSTQLPTIDAISSVADLTNAGMIHRGDRLEIPTS